MCMVVEDRTSCINLGHREHFMNSLYEGLAFIAKGVVDALEDNRLRIVLCKSITFYMEACPAIVFRGTAPVTRALGYFSNLDSSNTGTIALGVEFCREYMKCFKTFLKLVELIEGASRSMLKGA